MHNMLLKKLHLTAQVKRNDVNARRFSLQIDKSKKFFLDEQKIKKVSNNINNNKILCRNQTITIKYY